MAREEKRYGFKPVEETPVPEETVIRLESNEVTHLPKPVRTVTPADDSATSHRLGLPSREEFETRTHQPGIEALIEHDVVIPDQLEENWGQEAQSQRRIPWGWFVLLGILLAIGGVWSLSGVKEAEVKAKQIEIATETVLVNDAKENAEADKLIQDIDRVSKNYCLATSVDELVKLVRHPERVRPLMDLYYKDAPPQPSPVRQTKILQPLTLDNRANFWMKSVELENDTIRNLIVEITESGEPKIDWETLVCYQPMKWDDYALQRPQGKSLEFRVFVERDNFFSHEFAEQSQWDSYRLTALNSDETLFGYAKKGSELATSLNELCQKNGGVPTSMVLRLMVPEGIQSRRGVVIEKILSSRWIYLVPPESGS